MPPFLVAAYGEIRAKPTWYKGVRFDSRLEAIWACFIDHLGIWWTREPNKYLLGEGSTTYLPDLLLHDVGPPGVHSSVHAEVRPYGITNEKALAFSQTAPILLFYDEPIKNQPIELVYKGRSQFVCFTASRRLRICSDDRKKPLSVDTETSVMRAYFKSTSYDYEAATQGVEAAMLGIERGVLGNLSKDALVVLHLLNSCLRQPCAKEELQLAAQEQGLSVAAVELALADLIKQGMLSNQQRRSALLHSLALV